MSYFSGRRLPESISPIGPDPLPPRPHASSEIMKHIALIGTGRHGSRYGQHIFQDLAGLQLAGISRQSGELGREQAQRWRTTFYEDWRMLVAEPQVDAVVAATPPSLNSDIARWCARFRKPLLLEKPLARNVAEAAEIVRLMEAAGIPLTVGQTLRYNPVIEALRAALPEMGQLHSFSANQRLEPSTLAWHDNRDTAGAGVLFHTAVHVFDALATITGSRVRRVMAHGRLVHAKVLEDLVLASVELESGVLGTSRCEQGRSCQDRPLRVCLPVRSAPW